MKTTRVFSTAIMRDSSEPDVKRPKTRHSHAVWPVSTVPTPLDQGVQKTCVHHAVATATAQGLLAKNGIVITAERLAEKFEVLVPGWQGLTIAEFCEQWNEHCSSTWIKNVDSSERYNLRLEASDPIADMEVAYEKLEQVRGVLMLVCAVKHGKIRSHAVTVDMPYRAKPNMRAINSWGASHPVIDVTRATFQYAVLIDPVVATWAKGGGFVRTSAYKCTTAYDEMKEQQEEANKEAAATTAAEEEAQEEEDPRPHHPDSDTTELAALMTIAQTHPALHIGYMMKNARNGKISRSGWWGVIPETDIGRKKSPWQAKTGEGNKIRLANGSLLECVKAVRDDPYRLGKSECDEGEES